MKAASAYQERDRKGCWLWAQSFSVAAISLWLPFFVMLFRNHRARRIWEDLWFWPGIFPGRYLFESMYTAWFGVIAAAHLVVWTLLIRRWRKLGVMGAFVCSGLSALNLDVLLSI